MSPIDKRAEETAKRNWPHRKYDEQVRRGHVCGYKIGWSEGHHQTQRAFLNAVKLHTEQEMLLELCGLIEKNLKLRQALKDSCWCGTLPPGEICDGCETLKETE